MILDELEAMGLDCDASIERMASAESILIAWQSSQYPSDMAWLLFRCTLEGHDRTVAAMAALTAIGTTVEAEPFAHRAVDCALGVYQMPPPDAVKRLVQIHNAILNDGIGKGLLQLLGEDTEEQRLAATEDGHPHMVAWQTLRACLLLTVEDEPAKTAEVARSGFAIVDGGMFRSSICEYFRAGLEFPRILEAWQVWNSASSSHTGRA